MGPIVVLKKNDYQVKRIRIEDTEAEVKRVDEALKASQEQLQKLYDKAVREVGEASAAIFEVHQMMLEDEDYLEAIQNMIRTEQVNAEYAVAVTGDNFAEMFASMDDDYMKARSADIKDISERLVRNLSGQGDVDLSSIEPSVIVADDLSPSETVQMDKDKILAFVTVHGSTTVSYTHLDVYKRQVMDNRVFHANYEEKKPLFTVDLLLDASASRLQYQEMIAAQGVILSESLQACHIPVSYTHLDVYKRQVKTLDDVDLTVNTGEILGIAGISGSGQKELLEAIAGLQKMCIRDRVLHVSQAERIHWMRQVFIRKAMKLRRSCLLYTSRCV